MEFTHKRLQELTYKSAAKETWMKACAPIKNTRLSVAASQAAGNDAPSLLPARWKRVDSMTGSMVGWDGPCADGPPEWELDGGSGWWHPSPGGEDASSDEVEYFNLNKPLADLPAAARRDNVRAVVVALDALRCKFIDKSLQLLHHGHICVVDGAACFWYSAVDAH